MKKSCHVEARDRIFQEESMHALKQRGRWTQVVLGFFPEGVWVPQMERYHPSGAGGGRQGRDTRPWPHLSK